MVEEAPPKPMVHSHSSENIKLENDEISPNLPKSLRPTKTSSLLSPPKPKEDKEEESPIEKVPCPLTRKGPLYTLKEKELVLLCMPLELNSEPLKMLRDTSSLIRTSKYIGIIFACLSWDNLEVSRAYI
jgi:hypothetical protein